jgi:hypothetical protein
MLEHGATGSTAMPRVGGVAAVAVAVDADDEANATATPMSRTTERRFHIAVPLIRMEVSTNSQDLEDTHPLRDHTERDADPDPD